jgi:lysophospholipase L1-like esterase
MASKHVIQRSFRDKVDILDWHRVTSGDLGWSDDVHPDSDGYKVIVNMWLYELYNMYTI